MWSHSFAKIQGIDGWQSRVVLATLVLVLVGRPCVAADKIPSWLSQLVSQPIPNYESEVPAVVLFYEKTAVLNPRGKVTASVRKAVKILTRAGQKKASGKVIYRTDSGKVRSLRAWTLHPSGGVKIYGKKEIVDISLVDDDLYDESRAAVIDGSADVGPGSVFGFESVLEDQSIFTQFSFEFQDELPVLISRFKLKLPTGWEAESFTDNYQTIEPLVQGSLYSWHLEHLPPITREPERPKVTSLVPRVKVNYYPPPAVTTVGPTFREWSQVSAWLASLANPRTKPDQTVTIKTQELTNTEESEFERIKAVAEFTQRIKYGSIQIGVGRGGGYIPHAAPEVLAKGYGDCKDKVTLMRSMLSTVGIESYPVAIYAGDRTYVRSNWPSPHQFNHQIIAVKLSTQLEAPTVSWVPKLGKVLFFDPTDPYTPLGYLPVDQQGSLALLITADGSEALLRAPVAPPGTNFNEINIKIVLVSDGSISGIIRERSGGSTASWNRSLHKRLTGADYRQMIERWLSSGASGTSVSRIEAVDREGGDFFLEVDFSTAGYGKTIGRHLLIFRPAIVAHRNFLAFTETDRKYAVVLEADAYQETVEVEIPRGFSVDDMSEPVLATTNFGHYEAKWRVEAGKFLFTRHLELDNAIIPPEEYSSVKAFFDQMKAAEQAPVVLVRQ